MQKVQNMWFLYFWIIDTILLEMRFIEELFNLLMTVNSAKSLIRRVFFLKSISSPPPLFNDVQFVQNYSHTNASTPLSIFSVWKSDDNSWVISVVHSRNQRLHFVKNSKKVLQMCLRGRMCIGIIVCRLMDAKPKWQTPFNVPFHKL